MRHLPRSSHTRAITMQVNPDLDPAPTGRTVLAVGRVLRTPRTCDNCAGFKAAKVLIGKQLITIHCSECVPASPTGGIVDDIEREDDQQGYEAEDRAPEGTVAR
ncbi:hypothetical protein [Streptomyces niveiscabiei]|uniref:hypothetical protein n=1 Tax=Streptomyces niveiscabiei TaxID=164115 RepID=UPI0038F72749